MTGMGIGFLQLIGQWKAAMDEEILNNIFVPFFTTGIRIRF
jgi:hypothetical protein